MVKLSHAMALGVLLSPLPAEAALTLVGQFSGNDCGGQGGFTACHASPAGTSQQPIGSPAIIKFNPNGSVGDISTNFSSVTGLEFEIGYDAIANELSFEYDPDPGDPAIHYVSVKQANGFALFFDPNPITSGSIDLDTYFRQPGWSHITFFNSGNVVPEPGTWALMILGMGAVGASLRRRPKRRDASELREKSGPHALA